MPYGNRPFPQLRWKQGRTRGEGKTTTPLGSVYERDRLPDGRLRATYRVTADAESEVLYIGNGNTAYQRCKNHFHRMWAEYQKQQLADATEILESNPLSTADWNIRVGEEKAADQIDSTT